MHVEKEIHNRLNVHCSYAQMANGVPEIDNMTGTFKEKKIQ
jgi:hypothetical protein